MDQTIHASAVLVGAKAVLIRGPSGAGKSRLAWQLLQGALPQGFLKFARLVGDDRMQLEVHSGRLLVRPQAMLAGLIEIRGLGIRRVAFEPAAIVGLVVDLAAADAERLPALGSATTELEGVKLPRLAVAPGAEALQMTLAYIGTAAGN